MFTDKFFKRLRSQKVPVRLHPNVTGWYNCGNCEHPVSLGEGYCGDCGAELDWWWACPKCGLLYGSPRAYCHRCGHKLRERPE